MKQEISYPAPRIARIFIWALLITFAGCSTGCVALVVGAAGGAAGAVYVMGKLTEEVGYDVPTVHEATRSALRDMELTLAEDRADRMSARMESEFADRVHVWITLESLEDTRTRITIRVGLTGDEGRSRRILDRIKAHLPPAAPQP
jgi:hypothetical protein